MRVYLGALGWVGQTPVGNRLRWSVPIDAVVDGAYLGLPTSVVVERGLFPTDLVEATFTAPTWPIPFDWWEPQGDLPISTGILTRVDLPKSVQAIEFTYQGSETLLRVYDDANTLVAVRRIAPGEFVFFEETEIAALEFLIGGGTMENTRILDLFANHDANVGYEQIAVLAPALSTTMSLQEAEARLGATSGLDIEEWTEFQQEIVARAIVSTPDTPAVDVTGMTRWQQFRTLLSARWRLSLLYGLGFLDGPDAGPGTAVDQIEQSVLLQTLPVNRAHIYRVRCSFANHPPITSNPIVVQPLLAPPLQPPNSIGYDYAKVRLFNGAEYELDSRLAMGLSHASVIGFDIEEEIGPSAILGTAIQTDAYTFQSWQPADSYEQSRMQRHTTLPFYDLPLSVRARSIDGWDRVSDWTPWTAPILPEFIHSPLPPPLMDAQLQNGQTRLFPRTPANRFTEWQPDHAATNTPGTVLEVMCQVAEPTMKTVEFSEPVFEQSTPDGEVDRFRTSFAAALSQPSQFEGGALIVAGLRATILEIDANSVAFSLISDGGDTAAILGAGSGTLQQSPSHPDLFTLVNTINIGELPGIIDFTDTLSQPVGMTAINHYAVRVNMGAIVGGLSNTVATLNHLETPPVPPPFSVEVLGVDFYDRTMVRIRFLEPALPETYVVTWADGMHDITDFHDLAIEGDYGPQTALNGLELFEIFSLPVQTNLERTVTFGVQAKTSGGFVSDYTLLLVTLPIYQQ